MNIPSALIHIMIACKCILNEYDLHSCVPVILCKKLYIFKNILYDMKYEILNF